MNADASGLAWWPAGRRFAFEEMVHWHAQGTRSFEAAARQCDTVVLGPHAGSAFPAELAPFIAPGLDRRRQADFSDCATSPLGRLWAEADPQVVFVENPHSRLVLDPNRPPPADPIAGLRECFARLERQSSGEPVSLAGVDAIRPVTFSGEPVLIAPPNQEGWTRLATALATAIANGPGAYNATVAGVIGSVLAARAGQALQVISLHDTMNAKMRSDGAIALERPEADRLPDWVNFGNFGDARGEPVGGDVVSQGPQAVRALAQAWAQALGAPASAFTFNRPYKGAHETRFWGEKLGALSNGSGALQVEFRREALLGARSTAHLMQPGADWPDFDLQHLAAIATALAEAGAVLRAA